MATGTLVRLSFMADLVQATFLLFVVMAFYRLLRHVDKSVAMAMVIFVVVAVAIISRLTRVARDDGSAASLRGGWPPADSYLSR